MSQVKNELAPCDDCIFEEGSKYCIEHCPHEAKANKPCDDAVSRQMSAKDYLDMANAKAKKIKDALIGNPQLCDDAVSRQAIIDLIEQAVGDKNVTIGDFTFGKSLMLHHIEQLPSVQPKRQMGKWIPFSERLPKPFEHCLITTTDGEVIYHYDDGHYSKYKAWMPLPEPYKVEPQESEEQTE